MAADCQRGHEKFFKFRKIFIKNLATSRVTIFYIMVKQIRLQTGHFTEVDEIDYDYLMQWQWTLDNPNPYVIRWITNSKRKRVRIRMCNEILGDKPGFLIDHKDGNRLNNSRSNLRYATSLQNAWNSRAMGGSSQYKGVSFQKATGRWEARICVSGENKCFGLFVDEKDAALAVDWGMRKYHGEFARLNFPEEKFTLAELKARNRAKRKLSSKYKGVHKMKDTWSASFLDKENNTFYLGNFISEEVAARIFDYHYQQHFGLKVGPNFFDKTWNEAQVKQAISEDMKQRLRKKEKAVLFRGVQPSGKGRYKAEIRANNEKIFCGVFAGPEDAAHAYDFYAKQIGKAKLNFPLDIWNEEQIAAKQIEKYKRLK